MRCTWNSPLIGVPNLSVSISLLMWLSLVMQILWSDLQLCLPSTCKGHSVQTCRIMNTNLINCGGIQRFWNDTKWPDIFQKPFCQGWVGHVCSCTPLPQSLSTEMSVTNGIEALATQSRRSCTCSMPGQFSVRRLFAFRKLTIGEGIGLNGDWFLWLDSILCHCTSWAEQCWA